MSGYYAPNKWHGPTEEEWAAVLEEYVAGRTGIDKLVKERFGVSYYAFIAWRRRTPGKDDEFFAAYKTKAELYMDQMQAIADGPEDEGADNGVRQNRDKIRLDFREKWLKAFDKHWQARQEVDITSKGERIGGIDELGRRAILAAADELNQPQ